MFKIIKEGEAILIDGRWVDDYKIEIRHPPEAIEEVEVPMWQKRFPGDNGVTTQSYFIKLKVCKACGLYVREK